MEDPAGNNILTQLILLAFLTGVNAFFACAEMAIVSVNRNKINRMVEDGNKKAVLVQNLLKQPTQFLSTIQVAITLAGFFASASAATGISKRLEGVLAHVHIPYAESISIVVVTVLLSYFTLVLGELVPKRVALQKAEGISLFVVKPIMVISKIASPFIKLLSASTNLVLRVIGMHHEELEEKVSEEEIRSMIEVGQANGVFNEYEKDMIESIFEFDDKIAREIMTSRTDVYAIDIEETLDVDEMLESRHSRIPVYQENLDHIIGILYVKEYFLQARKVGFENVNIACLLHKPYMVPETKNIDELFKELQASKQYMAVLIDEYGGFSGIVTIEDLVEEVMGNIEDHGDEDEPRIEKISDTEYLLTGMVTIDDLNDELHLEIDSENHDTISGLLLDQLGRIPDDDEKPEIALENLIFQVEEMHEKRIEKVRLFLLLETEEK